MWLSAVSATLVIAGFEVPQRQLVKKEDQVFQQARKTMVMVIRDGQERGAAVCIDSKKGLFLIHRNLVSFPQMLARTPAGRMVTMILKGFDDVSQLAVLEMQKEHYITMPDIELAKEPTKPFPRLFAVLPAGPLPVELASVERIGVVGESLAALPLLELKFEAALDRVGGAPIFDQQGKLVGIIHATLDDSNKTGVGSGGMAPSQPPAVNIKRVPFGTNMNQFGPTTLTVGFAVQPSILSRVVSGFTSEERTVKYPALGIKIADFKSDGVEVRATTIGLAADASGIRAGDIIVELGGQAIRNQVDYVRAMAKFKVGQTVQLKVLRGTEMLSFRVILKA